MKKRLLGYLSGPLAVVFFGVFLFFVWCWVAGIEEKKLCPPDEAGNIPGFLKWMPTPVSSDRFEFDGRTFYVLRGSLQARFRVPSGPPVYVFDEQGKMVDWCSDEGENANIHERWNGFPNTLPIAIDELNRRFTETESAPSAWEVQGKPFAGEDEKGTDP